MSTSNTTMMLKCIERHDLDGVRQLAGEMMGELTDDPFGRQLRAFDIVFCIKQAIEQQQLEMITPLFPLLDTTGDVNEHMQKCLQFCAQYGHKDAWIVVHNHIQPYFNVQQSYTMMFSGQLNIAAQEGHVHMVDVIVPFVPNTLIADAMIEAVRFGQLDVMKAIMPHISEGRKTALLEAGRLGATDAMNILLPHLGQEDITFAFYSSKREDSVLLLAQHIDPHLDHEENINKISNGRWTLQPIHHKIIQSMRDQHVLTAHVHDHAIHDASGPAFGRKRM